MIWKRRPSKQRWGEISSWRFMFSLYFLMSYTSYQSKREEIGIGRAVEIQMFWVSVSVSLKSHHVSYLEIHVLYLFHHTTAPSFPVAASVLRYLTPWSHRLYTYSSPFYSRVSSITANPSRLSHKTQQSGREEKVEKHKEGHRANSAPTPGDKEQVSICKELPLSAHLYQK